MAVLAKVWEALVVAASMFWNVGWSLVLGFAISGAVQTLVSNKRMRALLGRDGPKEIVVATAFGAASSSCSYASAAVMRSIFTKGAAFVPSLAFLFSSTNLVIELGIVLWILMAWQFTAAEWLGGLVLIVIMSVLVKLTYPKALIEAARERAQHVEGGMDHDMTVEGDSWWAKVRSPQFAVIIAQHFAMDWSMLWTDLVLGFVIAGFLTVFVPTGVWHTLFLGHSAPWLQTVGGAFVGPLIAILMFVCSIGNVPMAAMLWGSGISFGGVLAFLYADLIVLPLLDVYRKYYGLKMAAYIGSIFYVTMAFSAILMDVLFNALHLVPKANANVEPVLAHFSLNYTFWLNVLFGALAAGLVYLNARHPMAHDHHAQHDRHGQPEGIVESTA